MQNNFITIIGSVVLVILALVGTASGFITLVGYALEKNAEIECETWARHAEEYPLFYLTPTQKAQCDHYEVRINAPVK